MKYRKKPVVIEAVQWNGTNLEEIKNFVGDALEFQADVLLEDEKMQIMVVIKTLEGEHYASVGDFIIKGVHGEFYPCKPDIFEKTYEAVERHTSIQRKALETLDLHRRKLTIQQHKTFKGQIEAGDIDGFYKGLEKVLGRKAR